MSVPTPHISAKAGEIAKTVLMPGDPQRSKYIAGNFLTDPVLVNDVRGVQGYTGTWKGVPVTVMASGMGIPSICIYSWELFNFYDVDNIIRIGSAGAIREDIKLMDIVAAQGASSKSTYAETAFGLKGYAPIADYELLSTAVEIAKSRGIRIRVGNVCSADNFYSDPGCDPMEQWANMGIMAIEMEAAGLYANAARCGKRALCLCTISDQLCRGERLSAEERRTSFAQMIEVALDTAVKMA